LALNKVKKRVLDEWEIMVHVGCGEKEKETRSEFSLYLCFETTN